MKSRITRMLCGILLAVLFLCGCEDVITVDLRDTESKIVIEGDLTDFSRSFYFIISRTTDFYSPNQVEMVSGATIIVSDDAGNTDSLIEWNPGDRPGQYSSQKVYSVVAGTVYHATVTVDGEEYTASTTMPGHIQIDSLRTKYQEGGGLGTEADEGYRLHVYFQDTPGRPDYARILYRSNGVDHLNFYLYDGRYSDGNVIDYEYFLHVSQPGDNLDIVIVSLDRTMYYYFLTLNEVWAREESEGHFLDATPANPNTNWNGGALGYFGAFSVSHADILVRNSSLQ